MDYRIIKPDEYRTMPWKNGKGMTTELFVRNSSGSDKYIYRLSIAGITENGQFSDFSGYDRKLIMLEGKGIRLKHSGGEKNSLFKASDIAEFSGDEVTHAELVNGPIRDFNVITLRESCRSVVKVISRSGSYENGFDELFIYAVFVTEVSLGKSVIKLKKDELFFLSDPAGENIKITGSAILVVIQNIVA